MFHQKDFDSNAVDLIQMFLKRLDTPVCLVAHNGLRFDFPLLKAQIISVKNDSYVLTDCNGDSINCTDTLYLFREFSNKLARSEKWNDSGILTDDELLNENPLSTSSPKTSKRVSFSLVDVYTRVFNSMDENAHNAEGDCRAMLRLVQYLGNLGIDWFQCHYDKLTNIKPMYRLPRCNKLLNDFSFPYQRINRTAENSLYDTICEDFNEFL